MDRCKTHVETDREELASTVMGAGQASTEPVVGGPRWGSGVLSAAAVHSWSFFPKREASLLCVQPCTD